MTPSSLFLGPWIKPLGRDYHNEVAAAEAEREVQSMGWVNHVLQSTGDNNDWKNPSIIKGFQATSSPPILLATAVANNFCSHTRRADFPKGFSPEKRVLVTGQFQSTSCHWHSFSCCTSRVPGEATWTDISLLMQEEGWKSKDVLINSGNLLRVCVLFWPMEFSPAEQPVQRQDTLLPLAAVMGRTAGLLYDHPCHTDTCPCPWATEGWKNKGD